jgi:hypothetical protein
MNTIRCIAQTLFFRRPRGPRGAVLGPVLVLGMLGALLFPLAAAASGTLDQSVTTGDDNITTGFGQGFSVAQTFTAGLSGTLTEVDVLVLSDGSNPLTVKVEGVNGDGSPNDGNVLSTATIAAANVPGGGAWLAVPVSTASTKGTKYAVVLIYGKGNANWFMSNASYGGGHDFFNDGSGWKSFASFFDQNFLFKTFVTTPPVATSTSMSNASVDYGATSVPLTAQVNAAQTVSEGSVTFSVFTNGGQAVGTAASANVSSSGQANVTYALPNGTAIGSYKIVASYHDALDAVANFTDSQASSQLMVLDNLAPTTTASFGSYTVGSWTNQAVTVTLSATDNPNPGGSGVAATYSAIDTPGCIATAGGVASCNPYTGAFSVSANGSHTLTYFSVDNAGNIEAANTASIEIDTIAPTATPTLSGQLGSDGWYVGPVTATWHWADNQGGSGLTSSCPATSTYSAPDSATAGMSAGCLDVAGNMGTSSVSFKLDTTAPTITAQISPAQPASTGWYNQATGAPSVSFSCSDATSGIPVGTCPAAHSFGEGANQSYSASVKDDAGNSASAGVTAVKVDLTAPTVTYSSNSGTYSVDQQVNITCAASDSLSGVASNTCQNVSGPAYSFALGVHSYSATAIDIAGNTGKGATSFTIVVTPGSLQTVISRFSTDPSVTASLQQDVTFIVTAANANAKAGAVQGFVHLVQAQTGKSLTSAQATPLITLAQAL